MSNDLHAQGAPPSPPATFESSIWTLVSAAIFLYFGFVSPFIPFDSDPPAQRYAVLGFTWMGRIVGVGLLVVFLLTMMRVSRVALLELVLAGLATIGCLLCGAIWMAHDYTQQGFLLLIFGLLNASTTHAAWKHCAPMLRSAKSR